MEEKHFSIAEPANNYTLIFLISDTMLNKAARYLDMHLYNMNKVKCCETKGIFKKFQRDTSNIKQDERYLDMPPDRRKVLQSMITCQSYI